MRRRPLRGTYRVPTRRPSKYHAQPVLLDGVRFASQREARRWVELCRAADADIIRNLRRQVVYRLTTGPAGIVVARYIADFVYDEVLPIHGRPGTAVTDDPSRLQWETIVEDCKGFRTPMYRLKRKWMEAEHGITIRET